MSLPMTGCGLRQCTYEDSECTHWIGGYEDEPLGVEVTLDQYSDNLVECGPAGLGMFLPNYIVNPPACSVYSSVQQSVQHDTPQFLFFDEEHFDTDSMHDNLEENTRIFFNTPGIYHVSLDLRWQKNAVGDRAAVIVKNRLDYLAVDALHAGDKDLFISQSLSTMELFKAGDSVHALVRQDCGTDLAVTSRRWSPVFSATFLRPPP